MNNYKWAAIQPLTGGAYLGAEEAFGCPAQFILSYNGVEKANELGLLKLLEKRKTLPPYWQFKDRAMFDPITEIGNEEYVDGVTKEPVEKSKVEEKFKDMDLVIMVPVCSGISLSNSSRSADAPQNNNQMYLTRFALEAIKPKVLIYENSPLLFKNELGAVIREEIERIAKDNHYSMTYTYTNTLLHGCPQDRKRTFVTFWKQPDDKECPPPKIRNWNTPYEPLLEYLARIPKDASQNTCPEFTFQCDFDGYKARDLSQDALINFMKTECGNPGWRKAVGRRRISDWIFESEARYKKCIVHIEKDPALSDDLRAKVLHGLDLTWQKWIRKGTYWRCSKTISRKEYASTVFAGNAGWIIHPTEDRPFTVREFATLMGMPFDWEAPAEWFDGKPYRAVQFIGQNVPRMTMRDEVLSAKEILDDWDNKRIIYDGKSFISQVNDVEAAKEKTKRVRGGFKFS
jgi:site-specific DNA-cytosine methylase